MSDPLNQESDLPTMDQGPAAAGPIPAPPVDVSVTPPAPAQVPAAAEAAAREQAPVQENVPEIEGYKILGRLGEGGMGVVWRAKQLSTHREVALKLLNAVAFGSEKALRRFEREVELGASLAHPNIARIYDSGLQRGIYYYAMELVEGRPLHDHVRDYRLEQYDIIILMRIVCQAVQHAHQHGVIHRDLKPSNILVSADGQPHVLDFGLAKTVVASADDLHLSQPGDVAGTPAFMSPEQASGHTDQADTRSDVYSLGVILFRLLTGTWPHDMEGPHHEILRRIAEDEAIRPRQITHDISHRLEAILLKALALNPDSRYVSAVDLAFDLDNYLEGNPLLAEPRTIRSILVGRLRRHPVIAMLLVLALAVGAGTFAYGRVLRSQSPTGTPEARRRAGSIEELRQAWTAHDQGDFPEARTILETQPGDLRFWEWQRLNYLLDPSLARLTGHEGIIGAVAVSPDGRLIATAGHDKTLRIWEIATRSFRRTLAGHEEQVNCVAFSPDSRMVASGGSDKIIRLWEARSGKLLHVLTGHQGPVRGLAFSPTPAGGLISVGDDKFLRLWDTQAGKEQTRWPDTQMLSCVAWSPDGRLIATDGPDNDIQIRQVQDGKRIALLAGHEKSVNALAFSPDGKHLVSGSTDYTLHLWEIERNARIFVMTGHENRVKSVAYSPDGRKIASAGMDGTIRLWDAGSGKHLWTLRGEDWIFGVAFTPDSQMLVSGGNDKTLRLWDATHPPGSVEISGHTDEVACLAFSRDGRRLASGSLDQTLRIWDPHTGLAQGVLTGHTGALACVAFSPDGRFIASGGLDRTLRIWDATEGKLLQTISDSPGHLLALAFSPKGDSLVTASRDTAVVRPFPLQTDPSQSPIHLRGHVGTIRDVAFSADSSQVFTAGSDGLIKVWNGQTGAELASFRGHAGPATTLTPSSEKPWLASGGTDRTLRLWNLNTSKAILSLTGHEDHVLDAAFSPDGQRIFSTGLDGNLRLWDPISGRGVLNIPIPAGWASCLGISPDGQRVATGAADGKIMIWANGKTGE